MGKLFTFLDTNWLAVLGILIGVIGIILAYYYNKKLVIYIRGQKKFDWNHVHIGVNQICRWIKKDKFQPDFILGIPGAGIILSSLAVIELGDKIPIFMIMQKGIKDKDNFEIEGIEVETPKWRYLIPNEITNFQNKRVLILDDYAHSGDSILSLYNELIHLGYNKKNVKSAALFSVKGLKELNKAPDYTAYWIENYNVYAPWGHVSKVIRKGEMEAI